jgi:hypothetical protein
MKHRKMTLSAYLNMEMEQSSQFLTLLGGFLLLVVAASVRIICGAPYLMMLELGISDLIPPVWLMTLLCLASCFLIGCAAGLVLGYRRASVQTEKYKGCLLFVLLVPGTDFSRRSKPGSGRNDINRPMLYDLAARGIEFCE